MLTAYQGLSFVYELNNPIIVQINPINIEMYEDRNIIYTDDDIELEITYVQNFSKVIN